jgi:hypothetical protein
MKKRFTLPFIFAGTFAITANAANIAVLEIVIPDVLEEDVEEAELTLRETRFLTDELRRQAAITLPKELSVLSREQIISLISAVDSAAKDSAVSKHSGELETVVDICKALKSDFATKSSISKLGNLLTLRVELYECEKGQPLGDFTGEAPDLKGLMDVIRGNAPKLFKKLSKEEEKEDAKPELKVAVEVTTIPANIEGMEKKYKASTWVAVGFDILGVSALGFGVYQHIKATSAYSDYEKFKRPNRMEYEYNPAQYDIPYNKKFKKVDDAKTKREVSLISASVLLLSGVMVHVWF